MPLRSQRYRLTFEFELRDRGDYATVRDHLRHILERAISIFGVSDYCTIEKVEDHK